MSPPLHAIVLVCDFIEPLRTAESYINCRNVRDVFESDALATSPIGDLLTAVKTKRGQACDFAVLSSQQFSR